MYREILFRAKRQDNNKWIYGNYLYIEKRDKHFICPKETEIYLDLIFTKELDFIEIVSETVTQYIGVKDKENNKIFEEDIVTDGIVTYVVSYGRGGFVLTGVNKSVCYSLTELPVDELESLKIIGNRLDNPELLD